MRPERGEEPVAECVHPPHRGLRVGQHPALPAPRRDSIQDIRIVGDDRNRDVVVSAGTADDRCRLVIAEQDEHEIVVVERLHERDKRRQRVLDRLPVGGSYPIGVAPHGVR